MLAWHDKYNKRMKERVKDEGYPVKNPTDILSDMVSLSCQFLSYKGLTKRKYLEWSEASTW